jgi:hypothetical protein
VLFLSKPISAVPDGRDATERTWVYDARTGTSARTQAAKTATVFADFERIYTLNPAARAQVASDHPRFALFSRAELRSHDDRLDLTTRSSRDAQGRESRDLVKSLYMIKVALTEALDLIEQLEADFDYSEVKDEP